MPLRNPPQPLLLQTMPTSNSPSAQSGNNSDSGTKSGIISTPDGERRIPASVRPDGSKRKEIKIRPGYKPPEDVEVYKNRTAEAWKTRGAGGVPGAGALDTNEDEKPGSGKNAKRREARKKAKAAEEGGNVKANMNGESDEKHAPSDKSVLKKENWRSEAPPAKEADTPIDTEGEKEKQARNLKKKLRQARELREKKDKGESLLPEQFEKVIKMNELIRQLDSLGFDAQGERKVQVEGDS